MNHLFTSVLFICISISSFAYLPPEEFKLNWQADIGASMFSPAPVITDQFIIIGNDEGHLMAFDIRKGQSMWTFNANGPIYNTPVLYNNILYFSSRNGKFYAVSTLNGKEKWQYGIDDRLNCKATVYKENIILYSRSKIYALDLNTGLDMWKTEHSVSGSPQLTVLDDQIFLSNDMKIQAIDANSGKLNWTYDLKVYGVSDVCTGLGLLYVINGNTLICLEANSGKLKWEHEFDTDQKTKNYYMPLFAKNKLIVSYLNVVYGFDDKNGEILWKYKGKVENVYSDPVLYKDMIYCSDMGNNIVLIQSEKGKKSKVYEHDSRITSSRIVVKDNSMYFIDEKHQLNSVKIL